MKEILSRRVYFPENIKRKIVCKQEMENMQEFFETEAASPWWFEGIDIEAVKECMRMDSFPEKRKSRQPVSKLAFSTVVLRRGDLKGIKIKRNPFHHWDLTRSGPAVIIRK